MISLVLGLGFGDEGKGTIVDWLARQRSEPPLVIRYNGGPQAAHHVAVGERVHCFAQLGSASFVDGARTHLAEDMAVDLYALHAEIAALGRPVSLTVDPRCVLVTPWHAIVNRVREALRGPGRHGSTGRGIAEAKLDPIKLTVGELARDLDGQLRATRDRLLARAAGIIDAARPTDDREAWAASLREAKDLLARGADDDLYAAFATAARAPLTIAADAPASTHVILESAQGALLDRDHGFFPHVTPSRITRRSAEAAARALGLAGPLEVWGVLRAYHTRHGEGPFPSEDGSLAARLPERHNREDGPAGRFRVGWFDAVLARHAIGFAGPIDKLAVTCLDRVEPLPDRAVVDAWDHDRIDTAGAFAAIARVRRVDALAPAIEALLARPIDVASWGPTAADKRPVG